MENIYIYYLGEGVSFSGTPSFFIRVGSCPCAAGGTTRPGAVTAPRGAGRPPIANNNYLLSRSRQIKPANPHSTVTKCRAIIIIRHFVSFAITYCIPQAPAPINHIFTARSITDPLFRLVNRVNQRKIRGRGIYSSWTYNSITIYLYVLISKQAAGGVTV